jgi:raffinose/stachyose/melibiose transport system permease protein
MDNRKMRLLYTAIVALMTIPMQVAMIPLARQLSVFGLIDSRGGIAIVYLAFGLPFAIFLFTGFMRTIPHELAEAATIDGCGMFKTYLLVFMPLLKTVSGTLLILRGTYIWNDILVPLLTVRRPSRTTLPMTLLTLSTSRGTQWDIMFGASLLISLPIIIVFLVFQKSFISGIVAGAVKG